MIFCWFLDAWNHVFYCKYNSFGLLRLLLSRLKNLWFLYPFWHRLDDLSVWILLTFFRSDFGVAFGRLSWTKSRLSSCQWPPRPRNGAKTEPAWREKREGESCIATPPARTPYFSWFFVDFDNNLAIFGKVWRPFCDFWHQFRHPNLCICALRFRSNVA